MKSESETRAAEIRKPSRVDRRSRIYRNFYAVLVASFE
jgi:hypothetical protein